MVLTRSVRNVLTLAVALVALAASVWFVESNSARAASPTPVVYVATGENFPDALGAGPAAAMAKGPILLVTQNAIPGETAAELTRLSPDKIVIVGGTVVISASVEAGLAAYATTVERIAGNNRYDTAAKLSAATYPISLNADTLDGKDSSAFLTTTGKAADSDKLDGASLADIAPIVWSQADSNIGGVTTSGTKEINSININVPVSGFITISGSVFINPNGNPGDTDLRAKIDGTNVEPSTGSFTVTQETDGADYYSMSYTVTQPITAGAHTVSQDVSGTMTDYFHNREYFTVLFVPTGSHQSVVSAASASDGASGSEKG